MKWGIILFGAVLVGLLVIPNVQSQQSIKPTWQYGKVFINPFYLESMTGNVNHTFYADISPPDGAKKIKSAIVEFKILDNPSIRYYLWMNGKTCDPESYYLSTTFANSEEHSIAFDCTNAVEEGTNEIILMPDEDTGTVRGQIDFVYLSRGESSLDIFGTEYRLGDKATVFLQLKDEQGIPITTGNCFLNIYYPFDVNLTHSPYLVNAPMLYLNGSGGLYYYDIAELPIDIFGVYMLSASCGYSFAGGWVYFTSGDIVAPNRTVITGTYTGSTFVLNGYEDFTYTKCVATGGATKICQAYYDYDTKIHFPQTWDKNVSNASLYYMGESSLFGALQTFEIYNWSSGTWIYLQNNLSMSGNAVSEPTGVNDFVSNNIYYELNETVSSIGIIRIRKTTTGGTTFQLYDNFLNIEIFSAEGLIEDIKGSGEIHVNDWFNNYTGLMSEAVWTWSNRITNLTNESVDRIVDPLNSSIIQESGIIQNQIQSVNDTVLAVNQSLFNYLGNIFQNLSIEINQVASEVWSYPSRVVNITATALNSILNPIQIDLDSLNESIQSVNDSVNVINYTPTIVLYPDFNVTFNGTVNINFTPNVYFNGTVNNTVNVTIDLQSVIDSIETANQSIHDKLDGISVNITSVNFSVSSLNVSPTVIINFQPNVTFNGSVSFDGNVYFNGTVNNTINFSPNITNNINFTPDVFFNGTVQNNITFTPNVYFNGTVNTTINLTVDLQSVIDSIETANQSLHDKLDGMSINITSVNDTINALNVSPTIVIDFTPQINVSFNGSVYFNGTVLFNGTINLTNNITIPLTEVLNNINTMNTSIHTKLDSINASIFTQLAHIDSLLESIIGNFSSSVSTFINNIAQGVWGYNNRTLTQNLTPIIVVNFTPTIQNNVTVNVTTQTVYVNATEIAQEVWGYSNRTLTTINFSEVLDELMLVNNSIFGKLVLIQDDLTSINDTVKSARVSIISEINNIPFEVWTNTFRNLTYIPTVNATLTDFNFTVNANVTLPEIAEAVWDYNNKSLTTFCDGESDVGWCVYKYFWRAGAVA